MLSEATIWLGTRDKYVTLPVTLLETLNKLTVDGVELCFKANNEAAAEVLCSARSVRDARKQRWSPIYNKEMQALCRRNEGGVMSVFWK